MTKTDVLTRLQLLEKRPAESMLYNFSFRELLSVGDTIVSITSALATNRNTVSGSANVTLGTATHDSDQIAQVSVSGGTDEEFYCIDMLVLTANGNTRQCSGIINVKDACNG